MNTHPDGTPGVPAQCRHQFKTSKQCLYCGVSFESLRQHQRDELLRFALRNPESDEWATTLCACLQLIDAINGGATLVLGGPRKGTISRTFGATLQSPTGARCAKVYSTDLRAVLLELMREWQEQLKHPTPPSHDGAENA